MSTSERIIQYFFASNWQGKNVLWVRLGGRKAGEDQQGFGYPTINYTVERPATPTEAVALLPVINAGLSDAPSTP